MASGARISGRDEVGEMHDSRRIQDTGEGSWKETSGVAKTTSSENTEDQGRKGRIEGEREESKR